MTSIKIKFRTSKVSKKRGTCFIQLIHGRKMKTIATGYKLLSKEWNASKEQVITKDADLQRTKELLLIQESLNKIVVALKEIAIQLVISHSEITANIIVKNYKELKFTKSYFSIVEERIQELEANGQKRTAANYKNALSIFKQYRKECDIVPDEITGLLIKDFEHHLKSKGNSLNTISFYMRILKAAYNYAVDKRWVERNTYPFKGVFTGEEKTAKRAVDMAVIMKLEKLNLEQKPLLDLARDIFMFCLYTRGMPFIDISHLKKDNIQGNILKYKRHKTKQKLEMDLPEYAIALINKYSTVMNESDYLFPLLYRPERKKESSYESALKLYNMRLKDISDMLGLKIPLTSYTARHTWATLAKTLGVETIVISDAMGHTSEDTTRIYLGLINNTVLDQANNKVVSAIHL